MKTLATKKSKGLDNSLIFATSRLEDLVENPRKEFMEAIRHKDIAHCLLKTAEIHGHFCPGSALGVMASVFGLNFLQESTVASDGMENLMAIVEINACFADGVQAVSGCTLGNNALVYRDFGKHAVTFALRETETAVRLCVREDFRTSIQRLVPDFYTLMESVIKNRTGSKADEKRFKQKGREAAFALIQLNVEELFMVEKVHCDLPDYAPIVDSTVCPLCGEQLMSTKAGRNGLCLVCSSEQYYQLDGRGIICRKGLACS